MVRRKEPLTRRTCRICNKIFSTKRSCKIHVDAVHLKLKAHNCDHCGETFSQKASLMRHMKSQHQDTEIKLEALQKLIEQGLLTIPHTTGKTLLCNEVKRGNFFPLVKKFYLFTIKKKLFILVKSFSFQQIFLITFYRWSQYENSKLSGTNAQANQKCKGNKKLATHPICHHQPAKSTELLPRRFKSWRNKNKVVCLRTNARFISPTLFGHVIRPKTAFWEKSKLAPRYLLPPESNIPENKRAVC